jgi:hypothetical protein
VYFDGIGLTPRSLPTAGSMSTEHFKRESFQTLLANAFVVHESGLDAKLLATVAEIQQFIASDRFQFDEAMWRIANLALEVANASGVAIALLESSELVYRAAAGSAAKDVGRRVAAVLNISSSQVVRKEILRVENAENDGRIEAEICRQFCAMSLLMLPIFEKGGLRGVLQVLFEHAHSFSDPEIRTYRLMVGALEDGLSRHVQLGEKRQAQCSGEPCDAQFSPQRSLQSAEQITNASTIDVTVEQTASQGPGSTKQGGNIASVPSNQSQARRVAVVRQKNRLWTNFQTAFALGKVWSAGSWIFGALLSAAVTVGMISWVSDLNSRLTSTPSSSAPTLPRAGAPATEMSRPTKNETDPQGGGRSEDARRGTAFKRVWINANEVDYIAEGVTIKQFTTASPKPPIRSGIKEVEFGDDVTVRYFANAAPVNVGASASNPRTRGSTTK